MNNNNNLFMLVHTVQLCLLLPHVIMGQFLQVRNIIGHIAHQS